MNNFESKPPLWQVLFNAGDPPCPVEEMLAAEIRALRDWLVPEEGDFEDDWESDACDILERRAKHEERQRLRALLTTEASLVDKTNISKQ